MEAGPVGLSHKAAPEICKLTRTNSLNGKRGQNNTLSSTSSTSPHEVPQDKQYPQLPA